MICDAAELVGQPSARINVVQFGLGPDQAARLTPEVASAQALRRTSAQHITAGKLEAAMVDIIGLPLFAASALGKRADGDRRRHLQEAARQQPDGIAAHPLRG